MNPNQSNGKSPQSSSYFNFAFSSPSVLTGPKECMRIRLDDSIIRSLETGNTNFTIQFESGRNSATATIGDKNYSMCFEKTGASFLYYQLAQHKFTKPQLPVRPGYRSIDMYSTDMAFIGKADYTVSLGQEQKQFCIPISKPTAPPAAAPSSSQPLKTLSSPSSPMYNNYHLQQQAQQAQQQAQQIQEQVPPPPLQQQQSGPRIKLVPLRQRSQSPAVRKDDREQVSQHTQVRSGSQSPPSQHLSIPLQTLTLHPPSSVSSGTLQTRQNNRSSSPLTSVQNVDKDENAENEVKQERQSQSQSQAQKGKGKEAAGTTTAAATASVAAKKRERQKQKVATVGVAEDYDELEEELSLDELRKKLGVKRIGSLKEFEVLKTFYNKYQKELRASFGELRRIMPRIREEKAKAGRLGGSTNNGAGAVIVSSQQQQQMEEIEENIRKWKKMVEDYNTLYSILHDSRHLFKEFVVRYRKNESNSSNNGGGSSSIGSAQPQNKRQRMRK